MLCEILVNGSVTPFYFHSLQVLCYSGTPFKTIGAGIAQWLEHRTRD